MKKLSWLKVGQHQLQKNVTHRLTLVLVDGRDNECVFSCLIGVFLLAVTSSIASSTKLLAQSIPCFVSDCRGHVSTPKSRGYRKSNRELPFPAFGASFLRFFRLFLNFIHYTTKSLFWTFPYEKVAIPNWNSYFQSTYGIASGIDQLSIMFLPFIYTAITFIAISAVVVLLISLFVQPKAKHLSFRKIPLKQFRLLGRAALIFSIVLALMVVPTTITMASAYRALSNDYASWESLKDAVGISYNDVNGLYNDYWMPMVENFFAEMADRDNLCLSMAIDRAIVLDNAEMGKYDHIVVTDRAWVETTVFGDNSDKADSLIPIGFDDIHAELKDFLSKQLPIWTNTGEIQPEGMGICEFNGDSFLVLPPNASYGNSTIQAKNPLIILVEEPVKTLKVSSFLLPMSSSGNIVFKNEAVLRSVLNESPLMEKISSIDSFTEGALKYAQLFKQESFYYFAACALCLVSMGAAGIMSAQLWIGENRKRIFTLHTAGIKYSAIILPVLRKEVIVAVCTVLVGGIVVHSIRHPEPLLLLLSSAVLFLMYVLLNFVGYIFFSKREFLQMSFRRE